MAAESRPNNNYNNNKGLQLKTNNNYLEEELVQASKLPLLFLVEYQDNKTNNRWIWVELSKSIWAQIREVDSNHHRCNRIQHKSQVTLKELDKIFKWIWRGQSKIAWVQDKELEAKTICLQQIHKNNLLPKETCKEKLKAQQIRFQQQHNQTQINNKQIWVEHKEVAKLWACQDNRKYLIKFLVELWEQEIKWQLRLLEALIKWTLNLRKQLIWEDLRESEVRWTWLLQMLKCLEMLQVLNKWIWDHRWQEIYLHQAQLCNHHLSRFLVKLKVQDNKWQWLRLVEVPICNHKWTKVAPLLLRQIHKLWDKDQVVMVKSK